ncbi:MAG: HAD family hydrolase [Thermodesulfobacteriota bacterium]
MDGNSGISWANRRIEGIVFDVDGTLTDSVEAYYEVFRQATSQFGIQIRKEEVLEPMATGSLIWNRILPEGIANRDEKIKQFMKVIPRVYEEVFQNVQPFDGLEPVLKGLAGRGIRLGVVTSAREVAVRPLYHHALSQYFTAIITREDGFLLKPAPDGILECLKRMEVPSDHAVVVGDSPLDIRAGKTAGLLTIAVLTGIGSQAQLEAETPTAIVKHVSQLLSLFNLQ